MKKARLATVLLLLLATFAAGGQNAISRKGIENPDKWISAAFARGSVPPFSFTLDGVPSASFIKSWEYSKSKTATDKSGCTGYEITWRERNSGLKVTATVKGYSDFAAVEWTLRFTNEGSGKSGRIADVRSADFSLKEKGAAGYGLRRLRGSNARQDDFGIIEETIGEGNAIELCPMRGRSSDEVSLPFFNITAEGAGCGIVYSIGWTGTWNASFSALKGQVNVRSGLQNADFYLNAGESVRTPMASVLFWEGSHKMAGHNLFRQFVLAHHSPKHNGRPWAPLCGGFDWGDPAPCNEYTCLTEEMAMASVLRYKQFGIMPEVFWLDAGWYNSSTGPHFDGNFPPGDTGTWAPDSERFPNGFSNLSNLIHSMGAELMVWFEPERAMEGTFLVREKRDYLLSCAKSPTFYAFNLGNPEALDYLCSYIGDVIESNGIDHYRQDFNLYNLDEFWEEADETGRRGITEMKYIEGLYKYWDYLRSRFPGLQIDNCASGGRRFDLETASRATPLWRTDYHYGEPVGYQCHTYGINMFLPLSGTGLYEDDLFTARSSYSSAMALNFRMFEKGQSALNMKRDYDEYLQVRPYFLKDYYPLSGYGDVTGDGRWVAYQLHDPSTGCGYVVGFRREGCDKNTFAVDLQAMSPNGTYLVTDCNTGASREIYGGDLMNGFVLKSDECPGSILIKYEKQ